MRFNINRSPISSIDVPENLSRLIVTIDCLGDSADFKREYDHISEYNQLRRISRKEFFDTVRSVSESMSFPLTEYKAFRNANETDGPKITFYGVGNLNKQSKELGYDTECQKLMRQGFVSSNQYRIQKLLDSNFISPTEYAEINQYYLSRFAALYPEEVTQIAGATQEHASSPHYQEKDNSTMFSQKPNLSAMVQLKNGSEVPGSALVTIMMNLKSLRENNYLAFYDLVQLCKDSSYDISFTRQALEASPFLATGRIHDDAKNIVLSAVEGDDLEMVIGSPVAQMANSLK